MPNILNEEEFEPIIVGIVRDEDFERSLKEFDRKQ